MADVSWTVRHREPLVVWAVLLTIAGVLVYYFDPQYLLTPTVTTGGDTASHYHTAKYLKDVLLPNGQIVGWMPGNYAGFPLFLFYFPLPFLIIAVIGSVVPLEIAFKLVTVLGTFLLPVCAYLSLVMLRFRFPTPVFGALLTLPFLFMEANSMWGGNILSTLAGEFAFSLGFALSILFIGSLYDGITSGRHLLRNAVLIAMIGFSHGYTLLFAGLASLFFLGTTDRVLAKLKYLLQMHGLGFMLMGFWIVPLLANLPYNTRYNYIWTIHSIWEVVPLILLPIVVVAVIMGVAGCVTAVMSRGTWSEGLSWLCESIDVRKAYLWFCVVTGFVFYGVAFRINLVDIRFLPYLQIFLCLLAAVELGERAAEVRLRWVTPVLATILVVLWVGFNERNVKNWIVWNYSGFEAKPAWPAFSAVNRSLAGTAADPRVVYEHSSAHNQAGTPRAFESIPLFSGRSTLEGIYMQSSLSSPFVFYIQSEISNEISCPLPDYGCSTLNLKGAVRHLEMFNVKDLVVVSKETKAEIAKIPEYSLRHTVGDYAVYELTTNRNAYVVPLDYEPVLYRTNDWKPVSYRWFKNHLINDVHLVFEEEVGARERQRFRAIEGPDDLGDLPKTPVEGSCEVNEEFREQEILIQTTCIGKPLLIKVSYHPKWQVEGADKIYLASPSFMLIYPERERVRLTFSKNQPDYAGLVLTLMGVSIIASGVPPLGKNRSKVELQAAAAGVANRLSRRAGLASAMAAVERLATRGRVPIAFAVWIVAGSLVVGVVALAKGDDPAILYKRAIDAFEKDDYAEARDLFARVTSSYPETAAAINASYFAAVTYFKQREYREAANAFQLLTDQYPESQWVPESYYHIGLCAEGLGEAERARATFEFLIASHPTTRWADYAKNRLAAGGGDRGPGGSEARDQYEEAMRAFDRGAYPEARALFARVTEADPMGSLAELASYFYAVSFFKERRFPETIEEFERFIHSHAGSDYVAEAYFHIAMSHAKLRNSVQARLVFEGVIRDFPKSRWAEYSKEKLRERIVAQPELG